MEVREQGVDPPEREARSDEQPRPPYEIARANDRLENADGGRPDREHASRRCDPPPLRVVDGVPLNDRALIDWVANLLEALFPEPAAVAS